MKPSTKLITGSLSTEFCDGSVPLWVMLHTDLDQSEIPESGLRDHCDNDMYVATASASFDADHAKGLYDAHKSYLAARSAEAGRAALEAQNTPGKREVRGGLPAGIWDGPAFHEFSSSIVPQKNWSTEGENAARRMHLASEILRNEMGSDVARVFFPSKQTMPDRIYIVARWNCMIEGVFLTEMDASNACKLAPGELAVTEAPVLREGQFIEQKDEYEIFSWRNEIQGD